MRILIKVLLEANEDLPNFLRLPQVSQSICDRVVIQGLDGGPHLGAGEKLWPGSRTIYSLPGWP
jgi:hypothetical protein